MRLLTATVVLLCVSYGLAQRSSEQRNPCNEKSRIVDDAQYYDRYWRCQGGEPVLYDCHNGLVYVGRNRGVSENCDYPWRVRSLENGNKQLANGPISTEHCDWLYGIFGHETSCSKYYTCWNGTATEGRCSTGLLFNEEEHACDWAENVKGCQKHPLCTENANGAVPLGQSCQRYWQCTGGYPRLQRCPAQTVFHKGAIMRCLPRDSEDCQIPTTTTPLPEELDEERKGPGRPFQGGGRPFNQPSRISSSNQPRRPVSDSQPSRQSFNPNPPQQPSRQSFSPNSPPQARPTIQTRGQQQGPIQGPLPRQPAIPSGAQFQGGAIPLNNGHPVLTRRN